MATLYFVRDGKGTQHTSRGHDVPIEGTRAACERRGFHFFEKGPVINEGIASPFAPFRHVVVEVTNTDVGGIFDRAGFYLVNGMSPEDAQREFSIDIIRDV